MIKLVPEAGSVPGRTLRTLAKVFGLRSETVYSRAILLVTLLFFLIGAVVVAGVSYGLSQRLDSADTQETLAVAHRVQAYVGTGARATDRAALESAGRLSGRTLELGSADGESGVFLRAGKDGVTDAVIVFPPTDDDGAARAVVVAGASPFSDVGAVVGRVFLVSSALAGGAMLLLLLFVVDRTILARIQLLAEKVENEKKSERLPVKLDFGGDDELAQLAKSIEELAMLVQAAEREYRNVVEDQTESICRFDSDWRLTFYNRAFGAMCAKPPFGRRSLLQTSLDSATFELLKSTSETLSPSHRSTAFTHAIERGDGRVWYRSTLRANFSPAGDRLGGQWIAADVTTEVVAQRKLQDSQKELELLSARLVHLQDQERRRIARELHDSTAQSLSALEMNMSVLESMSTSGRGRRLAAETRMICSQVCSELRNISYLLHPPLLEEEGLLFAVRWFAEGFTKRNGIPVFLDLPEDFPRLDPEIETALFRVVQEALSNIYRHAGATKAWVRLVAGDAGSVVLEVRDNGEGFPEGFSLARSAGVGLAGMRERMRQLGGSLEVVSSPYGVSVKCTLKPESTHADS